MKKYRSRAGLLIGLLLLPLTVYGADMETTPTPASAPTPIRMHFANTEIGVLLSALGTRTHSNIVYSSEKKRTITVNISALTLEEALRNVVAAAGLDYRQVGRTYVVAAPADLRQALKPFATPVSLPLGGHTADQAVHLLDTAFPYLTAYAANNRLFVSGAEEDIAQAQTLLGATGAPDPRDVRVNSVLPVHYMPAGQIVTALKTIYPSLRAEAVGTMDKPGGTIGLVGSRSEVEAAEATIRSLDIQTSQPMKREFRLYNIRYSSAGALKNFLSSAVPGVTVVAGPESYAPSAPSFRPLTGASLGASGKGGDSGSSNGGAASGADSSASGAAGKPNGDMKAKVLVLSGAPEELDSAIKLLEQLDTAPKQVMVEVKVVDTSPQFAEELGIKYNFAPIAIGNAPAGTQLDPSNGAAAQPTTVPFNMMTFSRLGFGVGALLSAVRTRTDTKLLADPSVQVVDNEDANIFIGDTIRTQISQAGLNGTTIQVFEFPVGIILLVRPRVNSDGNLTMRVHPVVSTITGFGPNNLPQSSSREVETTVMMKDGETIVIGGLIRDEYSKIVQEVPLLSKLPLIGELFRNRSTNRRRSDVMVFITTHIIKGPQ